MTQQIRKTDLEAYLDEALPVAAMAAIEESLRRQPALLAELVSINARRDAGVHSLGEIWRRHRISCPTRTQLGSYLLGAVSKELTAYVEFHLETIGCRWCQANLKDLQNQQSERGETVAHRRRKYYESSAGYLQSARGPR